MPHAPAGAAPRARVHITSLLAAVLCASSIARGAAAATDHVVVDEYLTRCLDGSSAGAFVELNATGPGQTFDATVGLRLLGPSGGVPGISFPFFPQKNDQ